MVLDPSLWASGLTFSGFLALSRKRALLEEFYARSPGTPLPEGVAFVLALVEDWCPDCQQAIPVLAKAAGERARFFLRDQNPHLREAYRLVEKRIVPTFVFLDGGFRELARWYGPPQAARAFLQEARGRLAGRALLEAYHARFPQWAEAMREEWARLLNPP